VAIINNLFIVVLYYGNIYNAMIIKNVEISKRRKISKHSELWFVFYDYLLSASTNLFNVREN